MLDIVFNLSFFIKKFPDNYVEWLLTIFFCIFIIFICFLWAKKDKNKEEYDNSIIASGATFFIFIFLICFFICFLAAVEFAIRSSHLYDYCDIYQNTKICKTIKRQNEVYSSYIDNNCSYKWFNKRTENCLYYYQYDLLTKEQICKMIEKMDKYYNEKDKLAKENYYNQKMKNKEYLNKLHKIPID